MAGWLVILKSLAANGSGLVAVGDFEKLLLNYPQKLIRSTQLKTCTSAPIATNPCYAFGR